MTLTLPARFSPRWTLLHLRTSSYGAPYRFSGGARARRLVRLSGAGGRLRLLEFDFGRPGRLCVRVVAGEAPGEAADRAPEDEIDRLAGWIWSLDHDLGACYAALGRDSRLAALLLRHAGLRLVRAPDLYETLLVAILGQQVSVAAAGAVRGRLMEALGEHVTVGGHTYRAYPPPQRLLGAGDTKLRGLGVSRQKARYLREVAARAAAGELDARRFAPLDDRGALQALREIPGVGRWTAEIALMRGLGRPDVFPAADVGLLVALQETLELPHRPSEDEARAHARRWRGWGSYAALHLWMLLQERTAKPRDAGASIR